MTPARWIGILIGVGVLGTLGDRFFHHHLGVVHYATPDQPWWVFLIMGPAGVIMVAAVQQLERRVGWDAPPPDRRQVAIDSGLALAAYATSGVFGHHVVAVTVLLTAIWAFRAVDRGRMSLVNALATAVGGPAVEAVLIGAGLFWYDASLHGVVPFPWWLPPLYLHIGLCAESLGRWLKSERLW